MKFLLFIFFLSPIFAIAGDEKKFIHFQTKGIAIDYNATLQSRLSLTGLNTFAPSESITIDQNGKMEILDFPYFSHKQSSNKLTIVGRSRDIEKTIEVSSSPSFPGALLFEVTYKNISSQNIKVTDWKNHAYGFPNKEELWAYLPASFEPRPNWIQPLNPGFEQKNFLGMNTTDYGGGTPILGLWRKNLGIAIGSIETKPKEISFPVSYKNDLVHFQLERNVAVNLAPQESFKTIKTFILPFHRDIFQPLRKYSAHMRNQGFNMAKASQENIGPIWCAWGYGRDFTLEQVMKTLPMVKKLGFEWVALDDGWQKAIGDWSPHPQKFPGGDADMKKFVKEIHQMGLKAQLWWAPLAAHRDSQLLKDHPNYLLKNADGSGRDITWWDSQYLCAAMPEVRDMNKMLVKKFITDWGFDGLKTDGQHLNASPKCYNPTHNHKGPEDSFENHPLAFSDIYSAAISANKAALVET